MATPTILLAQISWVETDRANDTDVWAPIGISYVASALLADGHSVRCVVLSPDRSGHARLIDEIAALNPTIVGISATGNEIDELKTMAALVKRHQPEAKVIAGGYCSMEPELVLASDAIDVVVIGEGESTARELVAALRSQTRELSSISGLVFRSPSGVLLRTSPRAPIRDLDTLPIPAYSHWPPKSTLLRVYASRGCPFECTFCRIKDYYTTSQVRHHSAEYVERLLARLLDLHEGTVEVVYFNDDEFLIDRNHLDAMASVARRFNLEICFQTRASDIVKHKCVIRKHLDAIHQIHVGVESFSQSQLNRWKKRSSPEVNLEALSILSDLGCSYYPYILLTDAYTTTEEIRQTCEGILKLPACPIKPYGNVAAGTPSLSPFLSGLHFNRMKNFLGRFERRPETAYLDVLWSFIDATNHRTKQLSNLIRHNVLSLLEAGTWQVEARKQLAQRIQLIPALAERLANNRRESWAKCVSVTAERYNNSCDDLILTYLAEAVDRRAGISAIGSRHEMVQ
jgi:pyruvate-formate lyase-activating enzyme